MLFGPVLYLIGFWHGASFDALLIFLDSSGLFLVEFEFMQRRQIWGWQLMVELQVFSYLLVHVLWIADIA